MTPGVWVRTVQAGLSWSAGHSLIASVPRGDSLLRIHFGWGFYGDTSSSTSLLNVAQNLQVMGIVTTVGNGTETVPNARTAAGNASPPTQRWVYWEGRAPKIAGIDDGLSLAIWQDSGAQEPVQTEAQVSAATIPAGDSLNVWASWAPGSAWDATGTVELWYYASLLYKPSG